MKPKAPKTPKKVSASSGMNPKKERREVGQKNPGSNLGCGTMRKSMPRGR